MKKVLFLSFILLISLSLKAQLKVAILETVDKGQNISYGVKLLLRSSLTSAISNTPGYEGYDRVDMASIVGEQDFQRTGNVSDDQIKQVGIATGAAYVLVAEAAKYDATSIIITAKILDVETFGIKSSVVQVTGVSANEMQQSCTELAGKLLNIRQSVKANVTSVPEQKPQPTYQTFVSTPTAPITSTQIHSTPLVTLSNGSTVYVAATDENDKLSYDEAVFACSCKGEGWRLPTIEELKILARNRGSYGDINTSMRYWTYGGGFTVTMDNGFKKQTKNSVKAQVRCVKESK